MPNGFYMDVYIEEEVNYDNPKEDHKIIINKEIIEDSFLLSKEILQEEIDKITEGIIKEYTEEISATDLTGLTSAHGRITRDSATRTLYNLILYGRYTSSLDILSNASWCIERAKTALNEGKTKDAQEFTAYASQFLNTHLPDETSPNIVKVDPFLQRCAEILFIFEYTARIFFQQREKFEDYMTLYNATWERYQQDTGGKLHSDINGEAFFAPILEQTFSAKKGIHRIQFLIFRAFSDLYIKYTYEVTSSLPLIANLIRQTFIAPPNDNSSARGRGRKGAAARRETLDAAKAELKASVLGVMQAPEHAAHWTSMEDAVEFLAKHLLPGEIETAQEKLYGQINRLFKSDEEIKKLYKSLNENFKSVQKRK